ncbi:hypothetical protein HpEKA9_11000 [Helicobacter pylori]
MNNPNLKDLEVIDTPGVNDPIISREECTKALLKDCDVVFIVSPSNQFLTDSDMSLFDRVSHKEGIQEIYFVASQADSAVGSMSEVEKSGQHLPMALENMQKSLSSSLNATMSLLKKKYPHQQEIFEKAIKNGVILTSGVCFSMYKDFKNQASWGKEKEDYQLALRNLTDFYPDAFNSDDKTEESLLLLSNMGAIKKQIEVYEKLSGNIETGFKEAYEEFILHFIKNIRDGLNETLTKAIRTASAGAREEEKEERYTERVEQGGLFGSFKRNFLSWADDDAGYDEVRRTRAVIKAGAVVDYLIEMHKICEKALNDSVGSFKIAFKTDLYKKVLPVLRQIINDDLIDEVVFKKSVHAVTDKIKFEKFDYTLPNEIGAKTGFLKGGEAVQFIQSVETYLRDFESETKNDVKEYCTDLRKELEKQDFANGVLSRLKKDMQNLKDQAQNKEQSIAQLDAKIQALKGIQ